MPGTGRRPTRRQLHRQNPPESARRRYTGVTPRGASGLPGIGAAKCAGTAGLGLSDTRTEAPRVAEVACGPYRRTRAGTSRGRRRWSTWNQRPATLQEDGRTVEAVEVERSCVGWRSLAPVCEACRDLKVPGVVVEYPALVLSEYRPGAGNPRTAVSSARPDGFRRYLRVPRGRLDWCRARCKGKHEQAERPGRRRHGFIVERGTGLVND